MPEPSYADLAALADGGGLAARVRILRQAAVPAERAPGLKAGHARLYLEAEIVNLLSGAGAVSPEIRYLADIPLDARGRAPKLRKREMIVIARPVAGRPGEVQLASATAQMPYSPALEMRLRPILAELAGADAPPRITGVRDTLSIAGTLAGESETQIFLATADGRPAALTVTRRPGAEPRWGVSWSELVDQSAEPARPETLAWYRLACALPRTLPPAANLGEATADRERAALDYGFVISQLGPCTRSNRE